MCPPLSTDALDDYKIAHVEERAWEHPDHQIHAVLQQNTNVITPN